MILSANTHERLRLGQQVSVWIPTRQAATLQVGDVLPLDGLRLVVKAIGPIRLHNPQHRQVIVERLP